MPCSGRYATAAQFAAWWGLPTPLSAGEQAAIEATLDLAAGNIHAARAAVGACDCTLAAWATEYLAKLNCLEAGVIYNASCGNPHLEPTQRSEIMRMVSGELEKVRLNQIEVCDGETGRDWPAMGWAEQSLTDWAAARIILNRMMRNP